MFCLKNLCAFFISCACFSFSLSAEDFTVASYNCGALSEHYDYIRAVCMQKLTQERCTQEPETMALLEKIQNTALKLQFSKNSKEIIEAQKSWDENEYSKHFEQITAHPDDLGSLNHIWHQKSEQIVSSYTERPIVIHDKEIKEILYSHLTDLTKERVDSLNDSLDVARYVMGKRIFAHQIKHDILCLQEADYLDSSQFPTYYEVLFSRTAHSVNAVAWNKNRFALMQELGDVGRGYAILLRDLKLNKTVLVVSGHLTGCNPFSAIHDPKTGKLDSERGDKELCAIIQLLQDEEADIKVLAMDSNVAATHPRLSQLKEADFILDYENYLEPTCTNPWQVLNTRIDWIAVKSMSESVEIHNIPVLGVPLNSVQANMSDHKPIAARIQLQ